MGALYSKPLRIYLLLGALAIWGVVSGLGLSTSLFPMSSQVTVSVSVSYGSYSSGQFYDSVGRELESLLQAVKADPVPVEYLRADYRDRTANYRVRFEWGAKPDEAVKAVETRVSSYLNRFPKEIRDSAQIYPWRQNQGFFAVSFFSPLRPLDEVHRIMEPFVRPLNSRVQDAESVGLYNPNAKEITVLLSPERMAQYGVSSRQVEAAINDAIFALNGGTLKLGDKEYQVRLPKRATSVEVLSNVRVSPVGTRVVLLKDVASLRVIPSEDNNQRFRTSGVESLILFANPKEGGNIKRMSDEIMAGLEATRDQWPSDVQFRIIVNPSEFIDRSISGVMKEVGLAAFLAVLVLFFFIGSFRNVVTAAIEIPLSLLLAFILMKMFGMNLNLISLGGLALSAGMNVDASVVVLENIFRHFEGKPKNLPYNEKTRLVVEAVNEVKLPILASTIASLVVFLPLIFTRGLTNSLLGDLAKAVIFSHGLSAVVALLLVPTIRLHLLRRGEMSHGGSPFEGFLKRVENLYERTLRLFLRSGRAQVAAFGGVILALPLLIYFVVPLLKKEVIGTPESDWLVVGVDSALLTTPKQYESELESMEQVLLEKFGKDVLYTFSQTGPWGGNVMLRLADRHKVEKMQAQVEETFKNTPTKFYFATRWNPSELRIPEPPQYRLEVTGGSPKRRLEVSEDLVGSLSDPTVYDNVSTQPATSRQKGIVVSPLPNLTTQPEVISRGELSHLLRVATDGVLVERIYEDNVDLPIYLRMPKERSASLENLSAIPVGFDERLIPLSALARFSIEEREPSVFRENQQALTLIEANLKKNNLGAAAERRAKAEKIVEDYRQKLAAAPAEEQKHNPSIIEAVPDKELQDALQQLKHAVLLSVALIFLVMVLQLGDVAHSLLVLVAIPLGFIGVVVALFVFRSSLSLNSGLGTILLNGIAVANSIILVDFIRRQFEAGLGALEATVTASAARLRPILMTSLTTVLGMFPIALGMGEGGKTLQPLGIAVCGGLWVSTLLTLYLVPCLQYQYLRAKAARRARALPEGALPEVSR